MAEQHPSIVVGYGRYGLQVLQSLLAGAAARGTLGWDLSPEVATLNERRLRSLALFWIPDVLGLESRDRDSELPTAGDFEMMLDLYEQIETVDGPAATLAQKLADRVEVTKQRIFRQSVGLDFIVVARPSTETVIGKLREVLTPAMRKLSEDPGLTAPRAGQDLLNFIQILDFEDFWGRSAAQEHVRAALLQSLQAGADAARSGEPTFGRVYLIDGRTERGNQDASMRLRQTILFLEFLMFEGQRASADVRMFYQTEHGAPPVCAIGIRAVELSWARLRRLAAAAFSRGWLEYLLGPGNAEPDKELDKLLTPFGPDQLDTTVESARILQLARAGVTAIEERLVALQHAGGDWPSQMESAAAELVQEWKQKIAQAGVETARSMARTHLSGLHRKLVAAVTSAFHSTANPATPGQILRQLQDFRQQLSPDPRVHTATSDAPPPPTQDIAALHAGQAGLRERQVEPERLRTQWWPVMAAAGAVAFLGPVRELFPAAVTEGWPVWAATVAAGTLLFTLFWFIGLRLFHPLIARRARRTGDFYSHAERGRIVDAVRRLARSDYIEGELIRAADQIVQAQKRRARNEALDEIDRLVASVTARKREIEWLRQQLLDFLNISGVMPSRGKPEFAASDGNPVLASLERDQDFQSMIGGFAGAEHKYQSAVRDLKILENWDSRFPNTFLAPYDFLERVSTLFPPAEVTVNDTVAERRASGFVTAVRNFEAFPASFYWWQTDGLPEQLKYSTVPSHWLRFNGAEQQLRDSGFYERRVVTPEGERLYLITARLGVPVELLRRAAA